MTVQVSPEILLTILNRAYPGLRKEPGLMSKLRTFRRFRGDGEPDDAYFEEVLVLDVGLGGAATVDAILEVVGRFLEVEVLVCLSYGFRI